jgi:hypothetical protein
LLVALLLSLVINFSYLLTPIITEHGIDQRGDDDSHGAHSSGVFHMERDLHGYIVCDCEQRDSVYVTAWQVETHKLKDGDHLSFSTRQNGGEGFSAEQRSHSHPRLDRVYVRNGEAFDFDTLYDRPSRTVEFVWQIAYYAIFALLMIVVFSAEPKSGVPARRAYLYRVLAVVAITIVCIFFAPVMEFRTMRIVCFFQSDFRGNAYILALTKAIFTMVVTILYSLLFKLMRQRQSMEVENERLKGEYLSTRYNMLVGQINPHFFFNSLNSLAMLVREKDDKRALEYIDQLSYTFRYIIQNGQSERTTLREELEFAEAYAYLFKIRYADKLFFDFDVDDKYMEGHLPALSLQPLIGNAVKHKTITTKHPLRVVIRVVDGVLEIENRKNPKLDVEPSTGIGLQNLRSRWQIIAGSDIEIIDQAERFVVRLPLESPKN